MTPGLTPAEVDRFARDGFLVLPDFVAGERCLDLRRRAVELAQTLAPLEREAVVFAAHEDSAHTQSERFLSSGEAIRCFFEAAAVGPDGRLLLPAHEALNKLGHAMHDLDPVFSAFFRTQRLAAVARDVGLRDPLLLQSMYIWKNAGIGGEVACHADHTYLWTEPRSVVGFWFAIDDATTENGCMWALPGGHRLPVKARSRLNAQRTQAVLDVLDPRPYPQDGLVPLPARRGTLIVLDGALPHRSGPNHSDQPRHACTLHVIDGACRYLEDNWLQRRALPLRGF